MERRPLKTGPCPQGHEDTPENFKVMKTGKRRCKVCSRDDIRKRRQANQDRIVALKDAPCSDCGGRFPSCAMDFDHRPGEVKKHQLGGMTKTVYSWAVIEAEIAKCDLVCANCHRIRTHVQRQHSWRRKEAKP